YIVGVATTKEKRHEGHMRAILTQAMEDLYQQGMGFAFLMPADAKIYQPFDFTYIFDQPHWKLKDRMPIRKHRYHAADETEQYLLQELSDWTNVWLQRRYEVYAFRSRIYYQRLMKELASEQGETSLLYNDERLVGVESIWGLDKREQRMLLCDDLYCEEAEEATPAIMARILHLENFIKMIGLKDSCKEESLTVSLSVEDQFCKENRGTYQWCLRRDGSSLKKLTDSPASLEKEGGLSVTISQLTSWLFGYSVPDREDWTAKVHTLRGVFLDEVV
ncbi:MAG: GNAT family N-acetyltransferase, partial [Hungatella sp.]